jgi:thymidylate synthase ThyX
VHPRTGVILSREEAWSMMAAEAADWAEAWADAGYHKQIVNRIIEPYSYITVLITATEWDNWYALRAHMDAMPEIQDVAYTMLELVEEIPFRTVTHSRLSDARSWHLPFVSLAERTNYPLAMSLAMSAARSARTSYLTHDKQNPLPDDDEILYRRLVESKPLHASPLEHQVFNSGANKASRNFSGGWVQHRALLEISGSIENFRASL